jgi:hypothetical protein
MCYILLWSSCLFLAVPSLGKQSAILDSRGLDDTMQIDFHPAVIYVVARLAGFDHRQADVTAYCSQYVDDATNEATIHDALMAHRLSVVYDIL